MKKIGCVEKGKCGVDDNNLENCYNCSLSNNILTCDCCNDEKYNCSEIAEKMDKKNNNFDPDLKTSVTLCDITVVENQYGNLAKKKCESGKDRSNILGIILLVVIIIIGVIIAVGTVLALSRS